MNSDLFAISGTGSILYDTPNRELANNASRWLSPDPAHASWNAYAYGTDPNTGTDPEGLLWISLGSVLLGAVDGPDPANDQPAKGKCPDATGNACPAGQNPSTSQDPAQNQANDNTKEGNTTVGALAKTMTNEVGSLSTPKKGDPDVLSDAKDALANALINNANLGQTGAGVHPSVAFPHTRTVNICSGTPTAPIIR